MISFGFFGSLSHIFSVALVLLTVFNFYNYNQNNQTCVWANAIFIALSGCFFLFFITSIFRSNYGTLLASISPMLPLPIIATLVIFHRRSNFTLSAKKVSRYSQVSIFFALIIYLIITIYPDPNNLYYEFRTGRMALFSGNAIPFSFVMLGISVFCMADWKNSSKNGKICAFSFFLIGVYIAGYLSGSRGTLLSLLVISPAIVFYISNKFIIAFFSIISVVISSLLIMHIFDLNTWESSYFDRIKNGFETLTQLKNSDESVWQRLKMWSAATQAISDAILFGYGVTERFTALTPYLQNFKSSYSHPHNDILAGAISSGFLGGLAVLISLISGFLAALASPNTNSQKIFLGLLISIPSLITGCVSTVLFNDISSAWLAFSAYILWAINFKGNNSDPQN